MHFKRITAVVVSSVILTSSIALAGPNVQTRLYGKLGTDANGNYIVEQIGTTGSFSPYFDFASRKPTGYNTTGGSCSSGLWNLDKKTIAATSIKISLQKRLVGALPFS